MTARVRPRDADGARPGPGAHPQGRVVDAHSVAFAGPGAATVAFGTDGRESELAERLDSVLGIAEKLAASHDRPELFRTIVDETKRALRVDFVTIRLVRGDLLPLAAWAGIDDETAAELPVLGAGDGWVAEVLRTGRPRAWTDARTDPHAGVDRFRQADVDADQARRGYVGGAGTLHAPQSSQRRIAETT